MDISDNCNELAKLRDILLAEERLEEARQNLELEKYSKDHYFKDSIELLNYLKEKGELTYTFEHKPRVKYLGKDNIQLIVVEYDDGSGHTYFHHYDYLTEDEFVQRFSDCIKNKVGYIDLFVK